MEVDFTYIQRKEVIKALGERGKGMGSERIIMQMVKECMLVNMFLEEDMEAEHFIF
jgi:hypothetical protein